MKMAPDVGESEALGQDLRIQKLKPGLAAHSLFLLPVHPDLELSATSLASCPPECCLASCHDDNGWNL